MGILDWLTDLGGSDMMGNLTGSGGPGSTMPPMDAGGPPPAPPQIQPTQPMPPPQGLDNNGPSPVQMTGQDAPPLPPGQQGAPSAPPVPMPQPRPAAADQPTGPSSLPPGATPTQGQLPAGQPPGGGVDAAAAVKSYQAAGGSMTPPAQPGGDQPFSLLRAIGVGDATANKIRSGVAAGFKAAGNSAGKSPMQALASGVGESMGGIEARGDKQYDQKIKYLQAAISAQAAGDKAAYNENYSKYLMGKLKADTDKAASSDGGGKKGAWNKPDSQKFIDAQHALANDPEIRSSQKLLEQTAKTGSPDEVAKAQQAHQALIRDKQGQYLTGVGLNPQKIQFNAQNPPGTPKNPHIVTSQQEFDQYVKPGDSYINPKDGKLYIRKGGSDKGGGESKPSTPAAPTAPEPPGPAPGTKTDDND